MGTCIHCGQPAGFLRSTHKQCKRDFKLGLKQAPTLVRELIAKGASDENIKELEQNLTSKYYFKEAHFNNALIQGFDTIVEQYLEDGLIDEEEDAKLSAFLDALNLDQGTLDRNGSISRIVQSEILKELIDGGEIKQRVNVNGHLPFKFQKSETLLWVFQNVKLHERKTRTEYRGGSSGVSVRVAKGVYYRTSSFRGRPVKVDELVYSGTGLFAITTKHVYFASETSNFRIHIGKIVTVQPYSDGIEIIKDGVRAKPQIFKGVDGWFTYNVIQNLDL